MYPIYLTIFLVYFYRKIRKDLLYCIPFLILLITNLNALLPVEYLGIGSINFADYFFVVFSVLYVSYYTKYRGKEYYKSNFVYRFLIIYIIYYLFLVIYSTIISNFDLITVIKISRYYFYGLITILVLKIMQDKPLIRFNVLFKFINIMTLMFSVLFILDSAFNLPVFVLPEGYILFTETGEEVKRNFYAFPFFTIYCILYNLNLLIVSKNKRERLFHFICLIIFYGSIIVIMTRGLLVASLICSSIMLLYGRLNAKRLVIAILVILSSLLIVESKVLNSVTTFRVLNERMNEVKEEGVKGTANFHIRMYWFNKAIDNVLSYNPLFGFGFTIPSKLGYDFMGLQAGNPDNAFANIIGVQGFFGLILFILLVLSWIILNLKLQRLKRENLSKVNFVFILWSFIGTLNSNTFSFIQSFGIFLAYDILVYSYFTRKQKKLRDENFNHNTIL